MPIGKPRDIEQVKIPKLTSQNYHEITELLKKYGGVNQLLSYWGAVKLDKENRIVAIKDYTEQSEFSMRRYEEFQPLTGIKYLGIGYLTYRPYEWTTEWLDSWGKWAEATQDDKAKILMRSPYFRRK